MGLWAWRGILGTLYHHDLQNRGKIIGILQQRSDQGGSVALSNAAVVVVAVHNWQAMREGEGGMSGYLI